MMTFCLLAMALFFDDVTWRIEETGIFQPLRRDEVLVNAKGVVFILNFNEAHITRYDENGDKAGVVGYKGKGPGGLTYPTDFFLEDDRLYVVDRLSSAVNVYKEDGEFIKQLRLPARGLRVMKVKNGWLCGDWETHGPPERQSKLFWADNELEETKTLYELKNTGMRGGLMLEEVNGEATAVFSPVQSTPILRVDQTGEKAFLSEPEGFDIKIIDISSKKVVGSVQRKEKPIPFDETWGNERLQRARKMMPPQRRGVNINANFPDYFPIVRDFLVSPSGQLVVNKWVGDPDNQTNAIAVGADGNEVAEELTWAVLDRLAAVRGEHAYLTTFDAENEEAGLARCSVDAAVRFVAENPIVFEGTAGRRIAIED